MRCGNCNSSEIILIDSINSEEDIVVTSDAQELKIVKCNRVLCLNCGCIEIKYEPENGLKEFFENNYDVSDEVQNNFIALNNRTIRKRNLVYDVFFESIKHIISDKGSLLEIACGTGDLVKTFKKKYSNWNCYGVDPSSQIPKDQDVKFIRDFFKEDLFENNYFDIVIAHGLLNRSPVLVELNKISKICSKGGLASFEFIIMEDSSFTPYIWDHPYMYTKHAFEKYLEKYGFEVLNITNCISSIHYLCQKVSNKTNNNILPLSENEIHIVKKLYDNHLQWWDSVKNKLSKIILQNNKEKYMLFGAGLFNAVLLNIIPFSIRSNFSYVIDEIKEGQNFFEYDVISLEKASKEKQKVLICCRDEYVNVITQKLDLYNIEYIVLNKRL